MTRSILALLAAFLLAAIVGLVLAFPAAGAFACPRCFGFESLGGNVFVEKTMNADLRAHARTTVAAARERVRDFYGDLLREPRVFVCAHEDCYRRFAGANSRGLAWLDLALMLAPDGVTPVIAAHELAHIELHARAGTWRSFRQVIPRWFDEGLAANVSNDPRYLAPGLGPARCRARTDDPLPSSRQDWMAQANDGLHAAAACRVSEWLAANGGVLAVTRLAKHIATGDTFDEAFRR